MNKPKRLYVIVRNDCPFNEYEDVYTNKRTAIRVIRDEVKGWPGAKAQVIRYIEHCLVGEAEGKEEHEDS